MFIYKKINKKSRKLFALVNKLLIEFFLEEDQTKKDNIQKEMASHYTTLAAYTKKIKESIGDDEDVYEEIYSNITTIPISELEQLKNKASANKGTPIGKTIVHPVKNAVITTPYVASKSMAFIDAENKYVLETK